MSVEPPIYPLRPEYGAAVLGQSTLFILERGQPRRYLLRWRDSPAGGRGDAEQIMRAQLY